MTLMVSLKDLYQFSKPSHILDVCLYWREKNRSSLNDFQYSPEKAGVPINIASKN